ncbi:HD domain-containing protein [Leptothoe kymatousa]|uniref:N-methyl-D-aspartate receptor NMDAR2C subunit n=1 Tax=Leptothoe kymatousa TAU-MAC 1615 TaxID=2364775 RepID=A0ABS5Y363_9CYAN|nr:hypothetical protein [Leptothoe kymatousa]MBT9311804.1 N-methyl-D-aspartate receptor NMDAR2C subunit [Leptothoe kymatousa TAU-MAC 1615]
MARSHGEDLPFGRWSSLCQNLGIVSPSAIEQEFVLLSDAYGESHRAYHTAQHINECLTLLDALDNSVTAQQLWVLEMALWYHDVVYQPRLQDNEQRSAGKAAAFLQAHAVAAVRQVTALVMATCHGIDRGDKSPLAAWMVDIDLAILGALPARFLQYEHQIRQEYGWVSPAVYQLKRRQVLSQFLQRSRLYHSPLFFEQFEHRARENLLWLLSDPSLLA